jgi:hypothetical protein
MPSCGAGLSKSMKAFKGVDSFPAPYQLGHFVLVLEKGGSEVLQKLRTERWTRIPGAKLHRHPFSRTRTIESGCALFHAPDREPFGFKGRSKLGNLVALDFDGPISHRSAGTTGCPQRFGYFFNHGNG